MCVASMCVYECVFASECVWVYVFASMCVYAQIQSNHMTYSIFKHIYPLITYCSTN